MDEAKQPGSEAMTSPHRAAVLAAVGFAWIGVALIVAVLDEGTFNASDVADLIPVGIATFVSVGLLLHGKLQSVWVATSFVFISVTVVLGGFSVGMFFIPCWLALLVAVSYRTPRR